MRVGTTIGAAALVAALAGGAARAADVRVQVGDVKDSRTTGKFFTGLEIELRLMGDDIEGARGLRCTVARATDDTGRNLIKDDQNRNDFSSPDRDNPNQTQISLQLKNPSRKAAMVTEISGEIEIFKPQNDPACVVLVSGFVGKPKTVVTHPTLTAAQIKMAILSKEQSDREAKAAEKATEAKTSGEQVGLDEGKALAGAFNGMMSRGRNSITVQTRDPLSRLIEVEFLDAAGKVVRPEGRMTMDGTCTYEFADPLPPAAQMRVYVATPKALLRTPFALRQLALP